jgi:predicted Co/Zn/Cd cation transporter (cation efflux family)
MTLFGRNVLRHSNKFWCTNSATKRMASASKEAKHAKIRVDVIIPVHNAAATVEEAVNSAMDQHVPQHLLNQAYDITVTVCCYDDGKWILTFF